MKTADKDYFLTEKGDVTADESVAHQLLVRAGQEISQEMADKYGIGEKVNKEKAAAKPVTNKAAKPSENKSAEPTNDKGDE